MERDGLAKRQSEPLRELTIRNRMVNEYNEENPRLRNQSDASF